jgi:hypothetical protein
MLKLIIPISLVCLLFAILLTIYKQGRKNAAPLYPPYARKKGIVSIIILFIALSVNGQITTGLSFCVDDFAPGAYVLKNQSRMFYGFGGSVGKYRGEELGEAWAVKHAKFYGQFGYYVYQNKYMSASVNYNLFDKTNLPTCLNRKALQPVTFSFEVGAKIEKIMFGIAFDCLQWSPQFKIAYEL